MIHFHIPGPKMAARQTVLFLCFGGDFLRKYSSTKGRPYVFHVPISTGLPWISADVHLKLNCHEFLDIRFLGDESNTVFIPKIGVHSSKLVVFSLPLKNTKRQLVFKPLLFRGYVRFREGI